MEKRIHYLNKSLDFNNLDFDINIIYQTGPVECVGKVWGANLAQGAIIDESISYIDLIVGKDDKILLSSITSRLEFIGTL